MKRKLLLFTSLLFAAGFILTSNSNGPGTANGLNRTGSDGGIVGCGGTGCHTGGTFSNDSMPPALYITDVNDNPVTSFLPGNTYIIKLKGTTTAPKWGFQISCSHVFEGDTLPAGWISETSNDYEGHFVNSYAVVEHLFPLTPVNDTMEAEVYWLAPLAPGVDTVTFYFAINNVDGDGTPNNDNWNSYTQTMQHWTASAGELPPLNGMQLVAYPNPVMDKLNIRLDNASFGNYEIKVFDMRGSIIARQTIEPYYPYQTSIDAGNWPAGMYLVEMQGNNMKKVQAVLKQ
jgi:hypothetical protein